MRAAFTPSSPGLIPNIPTQGCAADGSGQIAVAFTNTAAERVDTTFDSYSSSDRSRVRPLRRALCSGSFVDPEVGLVLFSGTGVFSN